MKTEDKPGLAGFIPYPFNRIMAVIDSAEGAAAVTKQLLEVGLADDQVELLCCDEGIRRLDLTGHWHGRLARFVRKVQSLVGDEYEEAQSYNSALQAGHVIVSVRIDDDEDKVAVRRVLLERGASLIRFFGEWTTEELGTIDS